MLDRTDVACIVPQCDKVHYTLISDMLVLLDKIPFCNKAQTEQAQIAHELLNM